MIQKHNKGGNSKEGIEYQIFSRLVCFGSFQADFFLDIVNVKEEQFAAQKD